MKTPPQHHGILLVDKPAGMTSHDVVDRIRRISRQRQVGHTGTLDPMATGLLVLCLGRATRVSQWLVGLNKTYVGVARLGAMSSTYDAEGEITEQERPLPEDEETVAVAMHQQLGSLIQLPPPYSAVKVAGKKLYEYARAGEEVPRKPRQVQIRSFDLVSYEPPELTFEARVGSGTYIRTMAHELGLALECGAYLTALRRTQVGGFAVEQALPLRGLLEQPELLLSQVLTLTEGLNHLPKLTLAPAAERKHLNGGAFSTREVLEFDGLLRAGEPVLVLDDRGHVLSICEPQPEAELPVELGRDREAERAEVPEESAAGPSDLELVMGATPMRFKPLRVLARPEQDSSEIP